MIRKSFLSVLASLAILAGCVTTMGYEDHEAFKPKLQETGGPKELYSIRSEQLTGLFTPGTTKEQILQRFGKPTMSGTGIDKDGKPNSWAVYTYFRGYSYIDTNLNSLFVNRSTSATLSFDGTEKLVDVSFSRFQKFVQGKSDRDATDEEVASFLGAPQRLDIKPATMVAGKEAGTASAATPAGGWKLGAEISELRSAARATNRSKPDFCTSMSRTAAASTLPSRIRKVSAVNRPTGTRAGMATRARYNTSSVISTAPGAS